MLPVTLMNHQLVLPYGRLAVAVLVISLATLLINWVNDLLKWPSDLEVEEKLLAIDDREAAAFAREQAKELWYDKLARVGKKPTDITFEDIFALPCLFAREDVRGSDTGRISSRSWAFVLLPLPTTDSNLESKAAIVVLTYADVLGFERGSDFYFSSTDYRRELADLRRADFHSMQDVDNCQNENSRRPK